MVALIVSALFFTIFHGLVNGFLDVKIRSYHHPELCSGSWHPLDGTDRAPSDLVHCASFCQQKPNECHGFKLNKATKACQLLNMTSVICPPFAMGLDPIEEDIWMAPDAFDPLQNASLFSVPTHADGQLLHLGTKEVLRNLPLWTRLSLWVKYKDGILGCSSNYDRECRYWDPSLSDWKAFASLNKIHVYGVMGILDGVPHVIGGYDGNINTIPSYSANIKTVEFFNETSGLWEYGPELSEAKREMSLVQVTANKIIIICGLADGDTLINVVETLETGVPDWVVLQPYPKVFHSPLVAKVVLPNGTHGILSVGGAVLYGQTGQTEAYFMDLDTGTWNRFSEFDFPGGCFQGYTHFYQGAFYMFPQRVGISIFNSALLQKAFGSSSWERVDLGLPDGGPNTGIFLETQTYTQN